MRIFPVLVLLVFGWISVQAAGGGHGAAIEFPRALEHFQDADQQGIMAKLVSRAQQEPFNVVASVLFLMAVLHTFAAGWFRKKAHDFEEEHHKRVARGEIKKPQPQGPDPVCFRATICHFLGEVEAIFGIWLIPLFLTIIFWYDWGHVAAYIDTVQFAEPIFVVVIMAIAASRPVVRFAAFCTLQVAKLLKGGREPGPVAWWFSILTFLPLLGSFITEPAAMTIAAMLLGDKFYELKPSNKLKYATLGALFVGVSVGGTLTHFAAPPVLMVAGKWGLDIPQMVTHVGWKAFIAILTTNFILLGVFYKEFVGMRDRFFAESEQDRKRDEEDPVPAWIIAVHLGFMGWTVATLHHPPLVVGGLLFFIAFTMATKHHQYEVSLKSPILVGFFLAGLVVHGGFQGWWIEPVLSGLATLPLYIGATILTAFNDNAAITYLASLVPAFDVHTLTDPAAILRAHQLQYAVLTGAVTGGGLTVIANAPNPAGQSILNKYFDGGISPLGLALGAIGPTIVVALYFMLINPSF
jgi:hypothetical protein